MERVRPADLNPLDQKGEYTYLWRCHMILVLLKVNGKTLLKDCGNLEEATQQAREWLAAEKKSYPHKKFKPRFFNAEEIEIEVEVGG